MKIYMEVTTDKFELPLCIADSIKELSAISGVNYDTVKKQIYRQNNKRKREWRSDRKFISVEIDND